MSDHAFVSIPVTKGLGLQIDDIVGSLSVPGWFVDNIVMLSAAGFELKLETTILRKDGRFKLRAISIVGVPCEPARVWGWQPVSTKVVDQAGGDHVTVDGKPPEAGDAVYWKAPEPPVCQCCKAPIPTAETPSPWRHGSLEVRDFQNTFPEIVYWCQPETSESAPFCWTIASWRRSSDDRWELHFCLDRPFDSRVDWQGFRALAEQGQRWLDENRRGE